MSAALSLALVLSAPPDPLAALGLLAANSTMVAVLHPAALWDAPMFAATRKRFPGAVSAGEGDTDAILAAGLVQLCQMAGVKSPAEVERVAVAEGLTPTALITRRTPFDPAAVAKQLPGLLGVPDTVKPEVTVTTLAGRPYLRLDWAWMGVVFLDGGRTALAGPPDRIEPLVRGTAAPPPATARFLREVRAGRHLVYHLNGATSVGPMLADALAGTGLSADGLTAATAAVTFDTDTTAEVWLDGCRPAADPAAAVRAVAARFGPQLRSLIPDASDDVHIHSALPFVRALADGLDKLAPIPDAGVPAARLVARGTPPPLFLGGFMGPMVSHAHLSDSPTREHPQLEAVTKALLAYQAKYGRLPQAYTRDAAGRPLLSWRVAILPFLDLDAPKLYTEFRQGEPWDSPHNLALVHRMPREFQPFAWWPGQPLTNLVAFTGPGTAFDGPAGRRTADFADGPLTALVGEGDRLVPWTKPEDAAFDPAGVIVGRLRPNSNQLNDRVWVGLADGTVRAVRTGTGTADAAECQRRLRALVTRGGGEALTLADLPTGDTVRTRPAMPNIVPAGGVPPR